jgi:hypothetical protein
MRGGVTNFEAKYLVSGQPTYELLLGASVGDAEEEGGGGGDVERIDQTRGARFFIPPS